jgi:hypothetical protein
MDLKVDEFIHLTTKMPFGKFSPARNEIITTMGGDKVPLHTPAGYGGLFWGSVYGSDGNKIKRAENYFRELGEVDHPEDDYTYWYDIDELISEHCIKYIGPYRGDIHHNYQSGFGGDECDGLIDFWTEKPLPDMPNMPFEIAGKRYILKWEYSSGSDSDSE